LIVFHIVEGYAIGGIGLGLAHYASRGFQGFHAMTVGLSEKAPSAANNPCSLPVDCFDIGGWYYIGVVYLGVAQSASQDFQGLNAMTVVVKT
jgi:hypothetical protein